MTYVFIIYSFIILFCFFLFFFVCILFLILLFFFIPFPLFRTNFFLNLSKNNLPLLILIVSNSTLTFFQPCSFYFDFLIYFIFAFVCLFFLIPRTTTTTTNNNNNNNTTNNNNNNTNSIVEKGIPKEVADPLAEKLSELTLEELAALDRKSIKQLGITKLRDIVCS